jgi:hypothetical protein
MEQRSSHVLRLAAVILGIALIMSLIVLIVGLVLQWNQPVQFSNGFFAAGAIVIVLGTFSITGGFQQRGSFSITYAESAGQASLSERTQRLMIDINQRYGTLVVLISTGLLLIGIAVLIGQFLLR